MSIICGQTFERSSDGAVVECLPDMAECPAASTPSHPDDGPVALADVFALGPEPSWMTCSCGALSARVPCFECTVAAERRADRGRIISAGERTIPPEFGWARLDAPELTRRVDSRRKPLEQVIKRLLAAHRAVLAGGSGAGKTSLAVACLRQRLDCGARFVSALELASARIQHAAGDGEAAIVQMAMGARLLVLDDLGEEPHTATSAVRDVIRARHASGLPTWITTGLRSNEIVAKYGDGIRRRVFDGAYYEWLGPVPERQEKGSRRT